MNDEDLFISVDEVKAQAKEEVLTRMEQIKRSVRFHTTENVDQAVRLFQKMNG